MDQVHSVAELIERTRNMPLEKMRFFINRDCGEPKCFGIYQEAVSGHWVVYKNKADGSRAVRYRGPDEEFAAQELWAKINSEIELRRPAQTYRKETPGERLSRRLLAALIALALAVGAIFTVRWIVRRPRTGYYLVDDALYYCQDDDWYLYDDGDWTTYDAPDGDDWYQDYYYGRSYAGFDSADDAFERSGYYVAPRQESHRDSDDSDIFDSWDFDATDWDSDW